MSRSRPRIVMCRPDFYGIEYEINPWMDRQQPANHARALRQWQALHTSLLQLGVRIELVSPVARLPDMVFTANAGLVVGDLFITGRFRHAERQGESAHFEQWFAGHGFHVACLATASEFEGAGDALFGADVLYAGYRRRSDIRAHLHLSQLLGCRVLGLELVDSRFYHLDTCFCPLTAELAIYYPAAFDEYGRRALQNHIPELIDVDEADACCFGCNAVVIGRNVILHAGSRRLPQQLADRGFTVHTIDLSEFLKAGGSAKCLTLRLDGEEAAHWPRGQAVRRFWNRDGRERSSEGNA